MKPTRYTGGELNAVLKDPDKVEIRFGFCFPDTYADSNVAFGNENSLSYIE